MLLPREVPSNRRELTPQPKATTVQEQPCVSIAMSITASTYIGFRGNCEEAITFYAKVLNGKIEMMKPYAGSPCENEAPKGFENKIMHCHLVIGSSAIMGHDCAPEEQKEAAGFNVSLDVTDLEEAKRIFTALGEGGKVTMPFEKTFWSEGFGMFTDKFGTPWMVSGPMTKFDD